VRQLQQRKPDSKVSDILTMPYYFFQKNKSLAEQVMHYISWTTSKKPRLPASFLPANGFLSRQLFIFQTMRIIRITA
jgi:hypothetical protein